MTVNGTKTTPGAGVSSAEAESLVPDIVAAVSAERGVDPVDLPPLYERVDPDALDALFASTPVREGNLSGSVSFEYASCTVEVSADGAVDVETLGLV